MSGRLIRWIVAVVATVSLAASCGEGATKDTGDTSGTSGYETNGLESKTSAQVLQAAVKAVEAADSVRISGTGTAVGQSGEMDVRIQGSSCVGSLVLSGAQVEITVVDDVTYLKTDEAGWQALGVPVDAAALYIDEWVRMSEGAVQTSFTIQAVTDLLAKSESELREGVEQTTIDGTKAVVITKENGDKLHVANIGEAFPWRLTSANGDQADLSEYGNDFNIAAPPDAVDMEQP
jgi:hypothetical protein